METTKRLYENCIITDPDGIPLTRCRRKVINWYLDRGLATLVADSTIRLHFYPKARFNRDEAMKVKINLCVVCGTTKKLNKHHIVPHCFRTALPVGWRGGPALFHDLVMLCTTCHSNYEIEGDKLKKKLADEFGISMHGYRAIVDKKRGSLGRLARSILGVPNPNKKYKRLKEYPKIPDYRIEQLKQKVVTLLGHYPTQYDLEEMVNWMPIVFTEDYIPYGKYIVDHMDHAELVLMWRKHFLDTMKPKYMPEYWEINRLPTLEEIAEVEAGTAT
jgi:hypothetical protein